MNKSVKSIALSLLMLLSLSLPAFAAEPIYEGVANPVLDVNPSNDPFYRLKAYDEVTYIHTSAEGKKTVISKIPVLPNGSLIIPGHKEMKVLDKTIDEVKAKLNFNESEKIDLIVSYHQRRHVFVIGAVYKPGSYSVKDMVSIYDAIATAGGFDYLSNKKKVKVIRERTDGTRRVFYINFPKEVFKAYDEGIGEDRYLVQQGDIIYVPYSFVKRSMKFLADVAKFATLGLVGGAVNASLD